MHTSANDIKILAVFSAVTILLTGCSGKTMPESAPDSAPASSSESSPVSAVSAQSADFSFDSSTLAGSSWKSTSLDNTSITALFGSDIPSDETGTVYFRFLKKIGIFVFKDDTAGTTSEHYFETTGTKLKAVWVSDSGTTETSASVFSGSFVNDDNFCLDLETDFGKTKINFGTDVISISEQEYDENTGKEVASGKVYMDSLPVFEVTTTSIEDGEWKQSCGLKEGNLSPELTWEPVDGATKYAVLMIDTTTDNWLSWGTIVDKTHLEEGEFTDPSVYAGPYPPGTHTYEVYVIALSADPKEGNFIIDSRGADINGRLTSLNTATDGRTGIVLAYGTISAQYTSPEMYYGYR